VKACEDEGIKTVAAMHESNGPKGYERPLVDHPKEADGMISRGNVSEKIYIPPLATVIGNAEIDLHLKATHDSRLPFLFDPRYFSVPTVRWAPADFGRFMKTSQRYSNFRPECRIKDMKKCDSREGAKGAKARRNN